MDRLIEQYGLALVFANVLAERIGLPIPAAPSLILAGALVADGKLSALAVFGVAFCACMIGDAAWYVAGRLYGRRVVKLLCRVSLSPDYCVRQTETRFARWGGLTLVLAKFVPGLSTISRPLAGALRLGWPVFLALNGLGTALWAGAAIGAGVLFHTQIDFLLQRLAGFGAAAALALGVLLGVYVVVQWWRRRHFYRMLRVARVSVEELRDMMLRERRPVVVDLRSSVGRELEPRCIPGAMTIDLANVAERLQELPADGELVFYCTCPNEASAAHAARIMMSRGFTRVRPLLGGLDAWIAAGYELEALPGSYDGPAKDRPQGLVGTSEAAGSKPRSS